MDSLDVSVTPTSPIKGFDQMEEKRAEKHQHLRGRNNTTSCRSPTRDLDTKSIKETLQHKRHLEFQKRRSVSLESNPEEIVEPIHYSRKTQRHAKTGHVRHQGPGALAQRADTQNLWTSRSTEDLTTTPISNSLQSNDLGPSHWASLWSEPVPLIDKKEETSTQTETVHIASTALTEKSIQQTTIGQQATSSKTISATEYLQTNLSSRSGILTEHTAEREELRDAHVQTEPGYVTVKGSEVQQLAEYLQEALWREEALKKKMAVLQQNAANLLKSSDNIWTASCSEDLLKNKITSLEAQLQLCTQRLPKDSLKKLVLGMERQKLVYEEKALVALQRATLEKTEALVESQSFQEALQSATAEASLWRGLYEEQRRTTAQLEEGHERTSGQVERLHGQLELSRGQQEALREQTCSLQRVHEEMQRNISLLEQTNQKLRNDLTVKASSTESSDFTVQVCLPSEEPNIGEQEEVREEMEESQGVQELLDTKERLRNKEQECVSLEAELEYMQQDYRFSQASLTQCRDQLRLLGRTQSSTPASKSHRSWTRWTFVFLLVFLALTGVAMLLEWHPPFRNQVSDFLSDLQTRVEDFVMERISKRHCYRPV